MRDYAFCPVLSLIACVTRGHQLFLTARHLRFGLHDIDGRERSDLNLALIVGKRFLRQFERSLFNLDVFPSHDQIPIKLLGLTDHADQVALLRRGSNAPGYYVQCVDDDGLTVWLTEFDREELGPAPERAA